MTSDQVVAARRLLGWSRERLGAMSSATAATVRTYELHGRLTRAADGTSGAEQLAAIRATLESAGIEFIEESGCGPGIRLQGRVVIVRVAQDVPVKAGAVTPAQVKAARELLGWGIAKLAGRSGTTSHLINTYERSGRVAVTYSHISRADPLLAIRAALEEAGIKFIEENGAEPGVRMRMRMRVEAE